MAVALCVPAIAGKKDKKKAQEPAKPAVVLTTSADSLSYAAGYQLTNGLMEFLLQQKMDTTFMADFIRGIKDANEKEGDPSFTAYTLGLNIAGQLNDRMIPGISHEVEGTPDAINKAMLFEGFFASLSKDTTFFKQDAAQTYFTGKMQEVKEAKEAAARKAGEEWLAENAKKEGVVTTASGLQYKIIKKGEGAVPTAEQEVTVKYEGTLIDGTVFDSSYKRNPQTTKFRANQVIKGWTEALTMMPVGSEWELYIPQELGYGDRAAGQIPPYSTLIFKVELVEINQ